jgi:hypothetical protein
MTCDCENNTHNNTGILAEAHQLINKHRQAEHGAFERNAATTSALCNAIGIDIGEHDVPLILMALKIARHQSNPTNRDNLIDAAGYLALYARLTGIDNPE